MARCDDLPPAVVNEAKRFLMDSVGCALGGAQQHDVHLARSVLYALFEAADNTREQREAARLHGRPVAQQPLSRRGFLTGGGLFSADG